MRLMARLRASLALATAFALLAAAPQPPAGAAAIDAEARDGRAAVGALRGTATELEQAAIGTDPGAANRIEQAAIGTDPQAANTIEQAAIEPPLSLSPMAAVVDCRKVACVALTFDDGPAPTTPRLLAALRKAKAPATFFVLGSQVVREPRVARQMVLDGHEIGSHSWDHPDFRALSAAQLRSQLARTDRALQDAAGVRPRLVRPPYGATNPTVRARVNRPMILWNVDSLDWKDRKAKKVAARATKGVKPGSIILLHDIRPTTVDAVPRIVAELRKKGFTLVTVSQLLESTGLKPGHVYGAGPAGALMRP